VLVRGEIEDIAPQLFADLRSGSWQTEYIGTKVDLRISPLPRWDLYPNDRAVMGTIQTSRGCPFECEFCDVIEYVGRKQRHKPVDLVLRELDALYRFGYRTVFLADDNFTVYRARAKELLAAIQEWNARQTDGRVRFTTQISIDAASDTEMLEMCADAGLTHVFIGIETPNEVSLREAKKRQNLKRNLLDEIQRIVNYGISVDCGMIVGFDNDEVDIFRRQYEFAMATAVPIFSLGALVAPAATPLHARLAKAGRLVEDGAEIAATPWSTNVIPNKMTREELFEGIRWLCNSIYHPAAFEQRMSKLVDTLGSTRVPLFARQETQVAKPRAVGTDGARMLQRIRHLGPDEEKCSSASSRSCGAIAKPQARCWAACSNTVRFATCTSVVSSGTRPWFRMPIRCGTGSRLARPSVQVLRQQPPCCKAPPPLTAGPVAQEMTRSCPLAPRALRRAGQITGGGYCADRNSGCAVRRASLRR
jgi:hypothetical protein